VNGIFRSDSNFTLKAGDWADDAWGENYKPIGVENQYKFAKKYGHLPYLQKENPNQKYISDGDIQRRVEGTVRTVEELIIENYQLHKDLEELKKTVNQLVSKHNRKIRRLKK
jgi:hypothetical protein